jgi:hypothetical protein
LLNLVGDILLQFVFELLAEAAWRTASGVTSGGSRARPIVGFVGCAAIGGVLGALSAFIVPRRIIPVRPLPGLSVLLAPVVTGLLMRFYGRWRNAHGRDTSLLATFTGGALAALLFAITRLMLVR